MTQQQDVADRIAQLRREKSARERRDIVQREIAEFLGISEETYSRYEKGRRKVPKEVVLALAEYFGSTPEWIDYGRAPHLDVGGQAITQDQFYTPEDLAELRRIVAAREKRKAAPPRPRKRGNDR